MAKKTLFYCAHREKGCRSSPAHPHRSSADEPCQSNHVGILAGQLRRQLDAQIGARLYAFVEGRWDQGFDPGDGGKRSRLDEYALRYTPWDDSRLNLQIGKFATVVGNWAARHNSWDNPLITAPLPYENLTGIWDVEAVRSGNILLAWANLGPRPAPAGGVLDDYRSVPIIWGPSYTSGAAVFGEAGKIVYAAELKNASLSSRPEAWNPTQTQWQQPTLGGRIGLQPDERWNFGFSASSGSYLRPSAAATMPPGFRLPVALFVRGGLATLSDGGQGALPTA